MLDLFLNNLQRNSPPKIGKRLTHWQKNLFSSVCTHGRITGFLTSGFCRGQVTVWETPHRGITVGWLHVALHRHLSANVPHSKIFQWCLNTENYIIPNSSNWLSFHLCQNSLNCSIWSDWGWIWCFSPWCNTGNIRTTTICCFHSAILQTES